MIILFHLMNFGWLALAFYTGRLWRWHHKEIKHPKLDGGRLRIWVRNRAIMFSGITLFVIVVCSIIQVHFGYFGLV